MADYAQIMKALRNAHAAGDTAAAARLAALAKAARNVGPDGMTPADRAAAAKAGTLKLSPQRAEAQSEIDRATEQDIRDPGALTSAMLGAAQGATFGFGDEISAGIASIAPDMTYDQALQRARGGLEDARFARPVTTYGAEIGAAVAAPGAALGAGAMARAPSLGAKALIGGAAGAVQGAAYGAGASEGGQRLEGAATGALVGGAVGAAAPYAIAGVDKAIGALRSNRAINQAVAKAPTPDDLRTAAGQLYAQADQVNGLPRADFATQAQAITAKASRSGMDADLTPGAAKVADRLTTAADDPSPTIGFREADILRRKAAVPASNMANPTERAIGSQMIEGIDEFIDNADPALSGVVKEAREMWGRLRRIEVAEKAIEKAKNTASGFENGLRIEFRKILNNPKLMRGFSEAEREAIKTVVRGTASGNLMRQIGRIGIGISGQSNALGALVGGLGTGAVTGNPLIGAAAVAAGTGAKALAERTTRKAAERAVGVIASRPQIAAIPQYALPAGAVNALALPVSAAAPAYNAMIGLPR